MEMGQSQRASTRVMRNNAHGSLRFAGQFSNDSIAKPASGQQKNHGREGISLLRLMSITEAVNPARPAFKPHRRAEPYLSARLKVDPKPGWTTSGFFGKFRLHVCLPIF